MAIALLSGGLDSATAAAWAQESGYRVIGLSFDYGQRHRRELQAATRLKLPVCSDFRTNFHAYSRHYGMGWLHKPIVSYLRKFHNRSQFTMVPTEALASDLQKYGFRRLRVVARGVDTERFDPAHRSQALRQSWGCG